MIFLSNLGTGYDIAGIIIGIIIVIVCLIIHWLEK